MSRSLSPCPAEVQVERLIAKADHITLVVRAVRRAVPCPGCARLSGRIHSYYERRLADLPWNGVPVRIGLRTRRFFCDAEDCPHRIFTERLPETTETYARRTFPMEQALRWLGLLPAKVRHRPCKLRIVSICCAICAKRWNTSWHAIPR
jgi:transposase